MTATGLQDKLVKARWAEQPNLNYTIYDVPILAVSLAEEVTQGRLEKIVENFERKAREGVFPRVHCGHHVGAYDDRPGAGYLDNLRLSDGTVYADIVEIPPPVFREIKNLKYPGRSVEICEDELQTLALLESQKPFFDFPNLALEDAPSKYSKRGRKVVKMADDTMKNAAPETEAPAQQKIEDSAIARIEKQIAELMGMLKAVLAIKSGNEETPEKDTQKLQQQKSDEPMTVAYSKRGHGVSALGIEKEVERHLAAREQASQFEKSLQKFCRRTGREVEETALRTYLQKFDAKTASEIVELLDAQHQDTVESAPLTKFAKEAFASRNTSKTLVKYSNEARRIQEIAELAETEYFETINHRNERFARQFKNCWPDSEKFVAEAVRLEKEEEGQYKRVFHAAPTV